MTNPYYTASGAPVALSRGASAILRAEFILLQNAFDAITDATVIGGTDGGLVNAYTLTPTTAITSYTAKTIVLFVPTITNTGASTLNVSGVGAINIKSVSGAAMVAGDLVANMVYSAEYNGTEFRLLAVTKNYVDQLAFLTALPGISAATKGQAVFNDGTVSFWANTLASTYKYSAERSIRRARFLAS